MITEHSSLPSMVTKSRLTLKEFTKANFVLRYSTFIGWISVILALILLIAATVLAVFVPDILTSESFIFPVVIMGLSPALLYIRSRVMYKKNARLQEELEFDFGQENLSFKSASFSTTMKWEAVHKVKTTKNWLFLYTTRLMAIPIPKKNLMGIDLFALKQILDRYKVKNNL